MDLLVQPLAQFLRVDGSSDRLSDLARSHGFEWDASSFAKPLPQKFELSFVAVDDEGLIGLAVASQKGPSAHLHLIAVPDRAQEQGVGSALLEAVEQAAVRAGLVSLTLKVQTTNTAAREFYRRRQFAIVDSEASEGHEKWERDLQPVVVCAVHQPNFFPNLGYFFKMSKSDVFVFLDDVQVPRGRSFATRNRIRTPEGAQWIRTSLVKPAPEAAGFQTYREAQLRDDGWRETFVRTIRQNYSRAGHLDEILEVLVPLLDAQNLADLGVGINGVIASMLGLPVRTVRQSDSTSTGQRSELIAGLAGQVDATHYLSGSGGGRAYNDEDVFLDAGLGLRYSQFHHPEYPQLWGDDFLPNLSVLDALFNLGAEGTAELLVAG